MSIQNAKKNNFNLFRYQKSVQEADEKNRILTETNENLQIITNQNVSLGEELLNNEANNKVDNQVKFD